MRGGKRNGSGRPKGSLNKESIRIKKKIAWLLGELEKTLKTDIKALNPKERTNLFKDLAEYITPKQQRSDQEGNQAMTINLNFDKQDANA